jgi:NADH dehydrogenase
MIARQLLAQGHPVRVLVRPQSDYSALVAAGAEPALGDLKDRPSLDLACAGVSAVISTANAAQRGGDDSIDSVDLHGNRSLIDAAAAAGVGQFIFVSALGSTADSPVPLFRAKAASEAHLRDSGVPYTIMAPDVFMDVWFAIVIGGALRAGQPVTLVDQGAKRHSFIAAADVAAYTVAALGSEAALNRHFPLGGPEPLSWTQAVSAFSRALGQPIPVEYVPLGAPLPHLPEAIGGMLTAMETYESPVEMAEIARTFGVTPTDVETFARQFLASAPPA